MSFTAIYDACVLHPVGVRYLLVRFAMTGLFRTEWAEDILTEMVRSVLQKRPDLAPADLAPADLAPADLERTRKLMCDAVPDCMVVGYHDLIERMSLPDPDDRHVLAAAVRSGSQVIVIENTSDIPARVLDIYNIKVQTPDMFVLRLINLHPAIAIRVVREQAAGRCRCRLCVRCPRSVTNCL